MTVAEKGMANVYQIPFDTTRPTSSNLTILHLFYKSARSARKKSIFYWVNVLKTLKADIVTHADDNGASCADAPGKQTSERTRFP